MVARSTHALPEVLMPNKVCQKYSCSYWFLCRICQNDSWKKNARNLPTPSEQWIHNETKQDFSNQTIGKDDRVPRPQFGLHKEYFNIPYFFASYYACKHAHHVVQKNGDPNYTWVVFWLLPYSPSWHPPSVPPLVNNNHETSNVAMATSNLSGGPSSIHHFVVKALLSHIVIMQLTISSHNNSNTKYFF